MTLAEQPLMARPPCYRSSSHRRAATRRLSPVARRQVRRRVRPLPVGAVRPASLVSGGCAEQLPALLSLALPFRTPTRHTSSHSTHHHDDILAFISRSDTSSYSHHLIAPVTDGVTRPIAILHSVPSYTETVHLRTQPILLPPPYMFEERRVGHSLSLNLWFLEL